MILSDISICNTALDMLGADPILSLDDDTRSGRLCKRNYDLARDHVLRSYPWNPAIRRAALPALVAPPVWGFRYQYALPEGDEPPFCLRVLQVEGEIEGRASPYRIEGRRLLSDDAPPLNLLYVGRIVNPQEMGPILADLVAAKLAADLAYHLTGSTSLSDFMHRLFRDKDAAARVIDAQEGTPGNFTADQWLESRF